MGIVDKGKTHRAFSLFWAYTQEIETLWNSTALRPATSFWWMSGSWLHLLFCGA